MRALQVAMMMAVSLPSLARPQASADTTRLQAQTELERIQADLETIKSQLGQVLRLLNQRPVAATTSGPARTSVADAPFLGRAEAPVTIVEFSDYQCPFCQRFFATTLATLKKEYIDTGKLRYVFRDYPIDQLHPHARKAAEAAHCAGEQGKYWEMHDVLFQNSKALAPAQLAEHARAVGAESSAFAECLTSGRHAPRVARGLADGTAAGLQGTPSFVVGTTKAGDVIEGATIRGAQSIQAFRRVIEDALAKAVASRSASQP